MPFAWAAPPSLKAETCSVKTTHPSRTSLHDVSSPPSRPSLLTMSTSTSPADDSMIAELRDLSPQDVELLNLVIQRAGSTATTFLTVFKAYSEVLTERGMDPHEVVYYGKLLKLGTLKGRNWGEKWERVKKQHRQSTHAAPVKIPSKAPEILPHFSATSCSLESNQSDDFQTRQRNHQFPSLQTSKPSKVHADNRNPIGGYPTVSQNITRSKIQSVKGNLASEPSSGTAHNIAHSTATLAHRVVAEAKERKGTVLNEQETWKKIRMQQDEEDADLFRQDKLLERCWDVWRQGIEWIISTNQQISEARDHLLLQRFLQRWRDRVISSRGLLRHVANLSDKRCVESIFQVWRAKLADKQQRNWRYNMRSRMKIVRDKHDSRLLTDAWVKWYHLNRSRHAYQGYLDRLSSRFYLLWKGKITRHANYSNIADKVFYNAQKATLTRSWGYWRKAYELCALKNDLRHRVDLRIIDNTLCKWRQRLTDFETGDRFYLRRLAKRTISSWMLSIDRIHAMEQRATRHLARADDLLLHAVLRVWRAKQNGHVLRRRGSARLQYDYWTRWKARFDEEREREALALVFATRHNSDLALTSVARWQAAFSNRQSLLNLSDKFHATHLSAKILLMWRIRLRQKAKMIKTARLASRFFVVRRAWVHWLDRFDERKREQLLQLLFIKRRKDIFDVWLERVRSAKMRKLAELEMRDRINKRLMNLTLTMWTNRVISIKLRELDIAQHCGMVIIVTAFQKWKKRHKQHIEERSLMESYLFVKREELTRRVFHSWLAAARAVRRRRLALKQKERQLKQQILESAWGKWRERFIDMKLRPVEYEIILQCQRDTLCTAFALWHAKTKSPPAIRFHAVRVKKRFFRAWHAALPYALQVKGARELDKQAVSRKCFEKWLGVYRKKKALKAVARARHLRLPAAPIKGYLAPPQLKPASRRSIFPRSQYTKPESDEDESDDKSAIRRPHSATSSTYISLKSVAPSVKSGSSRYSISKTRESSPVRGRTAYLLPRTKSETMSPPPPVNRASSIVSLDVPRRIWPGLHDVPRKSRPFLNPK